MEEAQAFRNAEQEILYARDHARGRNEPTVIQLRKQLIETQQELVVVEWYNVVESEPSAVE